MVRKRLTIPVRTLFLGRVNGGWLSRFFYFYFSHRNLYRVRPLRLIHGDIYEP